MAATALFLSACGETTADETQLFSPSDAQPFELIGSDPKEGSVDVVRDPWIVLRFSDFPDPRTFYYPAVRLGPRGTTVQFTMEISLVDREVRLRPRSPLLPSTEVLVDLGTPVRSLAGRPLSRSQRLLFRTGQGLLLVAPPSAALRLADLLAPGGALAGRCAQGGCHARGATAPAAGLDFASGADVARTLLLSQRRNGTDNIALLDVGSPETSYLLRKLLAAQPGAFTRIEDSPMPLLADPLSDAALHTVERWIRGGAN